MRKVPYGKAGVNFWGSVAMTDGCWLWTGATVKGGYGYVWDPVTKKRSVAHRRSWELTHGAIPDGLWVLHNCPDGDNPACVRPEHLYLGTPKDNTRDSLEAGTHVSLRIQPGPVRESPPHRERPVRLTADQGASVSGLQRYLLPEASITSPEGLINDWLKAVYAGGGSLHTVRGYANSGRDFLRFLAEKNMPRDLASLTGEHLREYLVWLRDRGLAHNTLVTRESHIRALFVWLDQQGEIPDNPWRRAKRLQPREPMMTPPTPDQMQAMLGVMVTRHRHDKTGWQGLRDIALVALIFDTGLRASELLSLRFGDVDRDTITVTGKGQKQRLVAPSPNVMNATRRYLRQYERERGALGESDALWQGRQGPITYERAHQIIQAAGQAVGLKVHPHLLRHGFATGMLAEGAPDHAVQVLLGHSSAAMTQRYTRTLEGNRALKVHRDHSPARNLKLT